MIGRLEGVLREKQPTRVLVDVGGVGYEIQVPLSTFAALPDAGKVVALRIHTHVREDAFQLFGFASSVERRVFELLLTASRVGPKLALTVLSGIEPVGLVDAIR
jgi:Holliday junction DNA helicase RuvA